MDMETVLPVIWFGVIGFGVLMYVLLDGFVLGLGILAPFADDGHQLDQMMNTAAPIWDGNETWLVLGGVALLAAFPAAYALVLSALYLPVLLWRAAMREGRDATPFLLTLCFFFLGFVGLVLGMWPNIVPPTLSIWEASSPTSSQGFLLVGLVVLLPLILGYTGWSYYVFRGKIGSDSGYH